MNSQDQLNSAYEILVNTIKTETELQALELLFEKAVKGEK